MEILSRHPELDHLPPGCTWPGRPSVSSPVCIGHQMNSGLRQPEDATAQETWARKGKSGGKAALDSPEDSFRHSSSLFSQNGIP